MQALQGMVLMAAGTLMVGFEGEHAVLDTRVQKLGPQVVPQVASSAAPATPPARHISATAVASTAVESMLMLFGILCATRCTIDGRRRPRAGV